jgi:hypothetical protein
VPLLLTSGYKKGGAHVAMMESGDQMRPTSQQEGNDKKVPAYVIPSFSFQQEDVASFVLEPMCWCLALPEARLSVNDPMVFEASLRSPVTPCVTTTGLSGPEVITHVVPDPVADLITNSFEDLDGPPTR